jgi:DNA-binding MarR family transcriptional regulator
MGVTGRQAVQASVSRLVAEGLAEYGENIDHRRPPLIRLTGPGSQKYAAVDRRQARWINELSAGLKISDLAAAARLLHEISGRLETSERHDRGRNDANETA